MIAGEVRDAVERVLTVHCFKALAWLPPRALVHAGEAAFQRIDAAGLPLQGGQQFPVVGVQLLQDGQVVGVDMVLERDHSA